MTSGFFAAILAANPILDTRFLLAVGGLVLVLLAGAIAFYFAEQWKKKQLADDHQDMDALTTYRRMFEDGELSREEYERVRNQLAQRIKNPASAGVERPASHPDLAGGGGSETSSDSPTTPGQEPPQT